jgi:hypothetical protein
MADKQFNRTGPRYLVESIRQGKHLDWIVIGVPENLQQYYLYKRPKGYSGFIIFLIS